MVAFKFQEMFPLGEDPTEYRLLTRDHISVKSFEGKPMLIVEPEGLTLLAEQAFRDVSHLLRPSHLEQVAAILDDPEASKNDRFVALEMLKNAVISAEMAFPLCQDTGTAVIMGKKGQQVWTDFNEEEALSRGVFNTYTQTSLRYSQNAPLDMYTEKNTGCNLPAQIDIHAVKGDAYKFLFIAKGGGSANKTYLYQETKAVLHPDTLSAYLTAKMKTLGTAACPPYHLAFVIGGTSAELNLKTVKLASAKYLDELPTQGNEGGQAFRDLELEERLLEAAQALGLGAQFGGKHFCLDVRVVRLPRHGASCPIGMGVSCSADRNIRGKITRDGIFLEKLETHPARFLPEITHEASDAVRIDLNQPMDEIRAVLSRHPVSTPLLLTGKIVVARDIAHAKLKERIDRGEDLPQYIRDHIIYYAGPAKTPDGYASGSFGPTTAARMDPYVPIFQERGGSMVMLAKGNRSRVVTESCKKYGGFYLGSIGGPAARLGKECITHVELIEYPELGMEAIYMITVKDFPAFILVDDKGNDFFDGLL
ncbi:MULTISPECIES: fumarate hydratase [Desulfococcus]|uniref:Fumarate hydratase class I n=1 Tax=Desulfococcus multivorans DSM 2059 TaxID=1121405 RepID=S7TXN0_DESML|nr:fumarate hydratase [Desulfococcus multivorans]AOY58608.1 FumA: fumarate hydratase class I (fumarase) [Desulfococcus multivorans]AQV00908.1 fumarate hydratase [Desulfococcus multivorans]EPR41540.1 hydro-lyase, Fe-S type, tartrate/fumarate subfamily, beta subunit [Desulfococcus multivorans DSM 2059]SJZ44573.1 fumarase, class I, homodimeric [Desulfococcus multivorans DSM 2059]